MVADTHTPSAVAVEDIVIPQGATESGTWPTPWTYGEGDPAVAPAGWPGSWTGRMVIRDYYGGTVLAVLDSTGDAAGTLQLATATVDGQVVAAITPSVPAAVSSAWTWTDTPAVYDLELTDGTRVIRLLEGTVTLSAEVTTDA
jgi:hypothetical protein